MKITFPVIYNLFAIYREIALRGTRCSSFPRVSATMFNYTNSHRAHQTEYLVCACQLALATMKSLTHTYTHHPNKEIVHAKIFKCFCISTCRISVLWLRPSRSLLLRWTRSSNDLLLLDFLKRRPKSELSSKMTCVARFLSIIHFLSLTLIRQNDPSFDAPRDTSTHVTFRAH